MTRRRLSTDEFFEANTMAEKVRMAGERGARAGTRSVNIARRMDELGIWVGTSAPATPITYAQWLAGDAGHWAWVDIT